jgi:hypothetical protein
VASKIDRIDRIDTDTGYKIEYHDYKSNILPFTRDEIENSRQLGLYDIVVRKLYPDAEGYEGVYDMLRWGRFPVTFSEDFRNYLRGFLINLWSQISATDVPEERLNKYCRWCERRQDCKAYALALQGQISPVFLESQDTPEGVEALFGEYERLSDVIKVIEERKKEVSTALAAKIQMDANGEGLKIADTEYYLQQNPKYEYDKRSVFRLLSENGASVLIPDIVGGISKASIERGLKSHPGLLESAQQFLKTQFNRPTLRKRKIKGNTSTNKDEGHEDA